MPTDRPNILLIFVDQQRFDTLSLHDHPTCRTPSLDRLAAQGVDFTRAYSCCGLCSPARASVMTGLYPHRHGLLTNTHDWQASRGLDPSIPTFAHLLSDAGYRTGYVGKVHLCSTGGAPHAYGFQDFHRPYHQYLKERGLDRGEATDIISPPRHTGPAFAGVYDGCFESFNEYWRAEETIRFLEEYSKGAQPFFLRCDFPGPHLPFTIPEPYASMYDPAGVPEPPEFRDEFLNKPYIHRRMVEYWSTQDLDWDFWQPVVAKYWGFVTLLDFLIARILTSLSELGLDDNTAVFYTTDHGDTCGSRRMFDKGYCMYEELYHIPFIARWPGHWAAGQVCEQFVLHHDLMPTFLDVAGVPIPDDLDSRSTVPLLEGRSPPDWRQEAVAEFHGMQWGLYSQRMIVTDRYKLVFNCADVDELYDLGADPHELTNRIDDSALTDVKRDLYLRLFRHMRDTKDPFYRDLWIPKWISSDLDIGFAEDERMGAKS